MSSGDNGQPNPVGNDQQPLGNGDVRQQQPFIRPPLLQQVPPRLPPPTDPYIQWFQQQQQQYVT